jgi:hypothetical protein
MPADTKKISEIAGRWKNANPELYRQFLVILEHYTFDVTVAVTEAASNEILQAQGRAQQARKFLLLFTENLDPAERATA